MVQMTIEWCPEITSVVEKGIKVDLEIVSSETWRMGIESRLS